MNFQNFRIANRIDILDGTLNRTLKCPVCGSQFRVDSKLGISLDIAVELFVFLIGFIVGAML